MRAGDDSQGTEGGQLGRSRDGGDSPGSAEMSSLSMASGLLVESH